MIIKIETDLSSFDFWSGAASRAAILTDAEFDAIESEFEYLYPDGMTETEINDLFWFEEDFIASLLGYEDWQALRMDR